MQLAEDIVNDRLPPDTRIQEIGVSTRFKVSRGPVREALRILETSGLVKILPRRGAVVTALSPEEVADLFEIRSVLFGLVASRLAKRHATLDTRAFHERLEKLRSIAAREDDAATPDFVEAVQEFGLTMSEASGSERLTSLVTMLFHQTLRYSRLGVSTAERRRESVALWEQVVEHIAHGRGDEAEAAARSIVRRSRAFAIKLLEADAAAQKVG